MSVFDFPTSDPDEIMAEISRVREYLQNATDPNESGGDGRTLLHLALVLCAVPAGEGEPLVESLLQRGANPNKPSPWGNFVTLVSVSESIPLVKKFIECSLRLNDVYETKRAEGSFTDGPSTLLDHLYGIRDYISPKRKKLNALANKYAGGLGKRRKFIDDAIALMESHGAKRAKDIASENEATH